MFSYLEQVLTALPQVLGEHWHVEGFGLVLQQPALVPCLICGKLFEVWSSVALWRQKAKFIQRWDSGANDHKSKIQRSKETFSAFLQVHGCSEPSCFPLAYQLHLQHPRSSLHMSKAFQPFLSNSVPNKVVVTPSVPNDCYQKSVTS